VPDKQGEARKAPENEQVPEESADELYEHAPCGYLTLLPEGSIVRVNQTFLRWTGYSRNALTGKRLQDLLPVPAKVFYETHYRPLLRMQGFVREIALDLICANNSLLPVFINAVEQRDAAGHPVLVRTTVYDATERRTYERELLAARRRAEQLAAVVEASADAIVLLSPDGIVQTWNTGAERLFGYTSAEARGRPISELIHAPGHGQEYDAARAKVRSGREVHLETVLASRTGRLIDASLSLAPHVEPPGELVGISTIIRDITERRVVQKQLHEAEKLESVGTLAGGVAHEVNNQMTVVLGFGQFVLHALGADHPQAADVQHMVEAAERAARVSRQLLAFSRQQLMQLQDFSMSSLLTELGPAIQEELGSDKVLKIEADLPAGWVSADVREIERVVMHLTRNARDAMSPRGEFRLRVDEVELSLEDARLHPSDAVQPGAYVLLTACDNGSGMDEDTLRRAFEPFFTTKPFGSGMGLGLATVYGTVKQHGGQVWASSTPREGSTIRVYLPAGPKGSIPPDARV
jgi:PAS domain S-box-containing protein